ncbi:B3 domain-containing transcription factor ABI3-like [Rosa rugosa]|uniref:B3 domain-containing transcription factor ABI3-like n=1 Tax=Rosa rugosa TaxID=74645 RepID=UPI002B41572C|nr:B3 domain-containing transcription factor ABI3-like [Rosa rugosa]
MEEPLKTLNLIDKLTGGEFRCPSIASCSSNSSTDPLEHHQLLCLAASSFTLDLSWWQPLPSTTKKRKGKELVPVEEESAAPMNHPKRRKLVLNDHQNNRELNKRSALANKDNDNESCLGLTLGVSPVSTTLPVHDNQLKEIRENRVAERDDDESILRLTVGPSDHHHHQRPVVHRSDPAMFNIKKKLTPSDLGHLSRLLLPKDMVKSHILPNFDEDLVGRMESEVGLEVTVFDEDRQKEYELIFKYLKSSRSYVFNGKWTHDFVKLLNLNKDDEIGLYLDTTPSPKPKFHFSLLKLAGQADEGAPALQQE